MAATSIITLRLLQGFALSLEGETVRLPWSTQRLLALLALKERLLTRGYVAGELWPDTSNTRAQANLRSALWRARVSCQGVIVVTDQQLGLAPHVQVDLREAEQIVNRILDAPRCDEWLTVQNRVLLSTDVLPDWYEDDWMLFEREQFHHLRLHALEAMSERLAERGRYAEAITSALAAIRAEPLRETAHATLIRVHLAEGNRHEALLHFARFRRTLLRELGLEPAPGLCALLGVGPDRFTEARIAAMASPRPAAAS
jgi:DNA-binding SARP family transcriptional activator